MTSVVSIEGYVGYFNECRFLDEQGRIYTRVDDWSAQRVYRRATCNQLTGGKHHWLAEPGKVPAGTKVCRICGAWESHRPTIQLRHANGGRRRSLEKQ